MAAQQAVDVAWLKCGMGQCEPGRLGHQRERAAALVSPECGVAQDPTRPPSFLTTITVAARGRAMAPPAP